MVVAQDKVVLIHYTLTNDTGAVIDSSSGGDPLAYIHGQGNIIPGLEKALEGKQTGDKVSVADIKPGMQFHAQTSQGQTRMVTVMHVKGDMVTVDGNHPLAGENLHFDVEITEVRDPSAEELEHGHVHGTGGHHHD
jgi:FKBP-type peptidyl-prolyl cis-trans isomerase SlyD